MRLYIGVEKATASIPIVLVIVAFCIATVLHAVEPAELVRQIESKLSSVQRQTVTSPAQAEKDCLVAGDLFAQLRDASPNHEKLSSLEKRFDDLKGKLEKRLGRPVAEARNLPRRRPLPRRHRLLPPICPVRWSPN